MKKLILALMASLILAGCSNTQLGAKYYGGNYTINLPKGEKLIHIAWSEDGDIWYLTRPMHEDEKPEVYKFRADTALDILEGTVTVKESK